MFNNKRKDNNNSEEIINNSKKIKLTNNNNNNNNLFLKLFRNIVIKKKILKYLRKYNKYYMLNVTNRDQLLNYEKRCYLTTINYGVNSELQEKDIPHATETIIFSNEYNLPFKPKVLVSSITFIKFGDSFNQYLNHGDMEQCTRLERLEFGSSFNQFISPLELPLSIKYLKFGELFNQQIVIDSIPPSIETLIFGKSFNQLIENSEILSLPNLKYLEFGDDFNQPILNNCLSNTLIETLIFGSSFNQIISSDNLPPTIKSLTLGENFICSNLLISLPKSIKNLKINNSVYQTLKDTPIFKSLSLNLLELIVNQEGAPYGSLVNIIHFSDHTYNNEYNNNNNQILTNNFISPHTYYEGVLKESIEYETQSDDLELEYEFQMKDSIYEMDKLIEHLTQEKETENYLVSNYGYCIK